MSELIKWKQRGRFYLWRYVDKERFPGWHVTADADGAESVIELLDLYRLAQWSCRQRVAITRPTCDILRVPNYLWGEAAWSAPITHLVLHFSRTKFTDTFWQLARDGSELTLGVGARMLDEFYEMVEEIQRGEGDAAIGPDDASGDDCIYYWWHP